MVAKAITIRPLVRNELVACVREDAGAVGLELFARPAGVEVGTRPLALVVAVAVGLDGAE